VDLDDRRETYQGFSESMAKGFEFAVIPVIFGAIGYGLDRWLGTTPVFILVLVIVALVGLFARMWYGYDHAMRVHEAEGPWRAGRSK
jgi:F0F1-type ATP synthase assembly protein I